MSIGVRKVDISQPQLCAAFLMILTKAAGVVITSMLHTEQSIFQYRAALVLPDLYSFTLLSRHEWHKER